MSLVAIANSFSVQSESTALYSYLADPVNGDKQAFLVSVYNNLFNRSPDQDGLAYWMGQLNPNNAGRIILDIISGAQGSDKTIVENKTTIAVGYANAYTGFNATWTINPDINSAKSVMSGVDATDASVTAASAQIATVIANELSTPALALTSSVSSVNEGGGVDFVLTGADSNQLGKEFSYALSGTGIATGDVTQSLTGTVKLGDDLKATIHFDTVADKTTEGAETMTLTIGALTKSVTINDTSTLAPSFPGGSTANVFAPEDIGMGTAFTAAAAGDSIVYSLGGTDGAKFSINAATGAVSFKSAPNFEAPGSAASSNVYDFTVTATDADNETAIQNVKLAVTDVNEAPTAGTSGSVNVAENSTTVTTLTVNDPDAGDSTTWTLGGADAAKFQIVGNALSFKSAPNFEAPGSAASSNTYDVTATAKDKAGLSSNTVTLAVKVTDVNEAPSYASGTNDVNVAENTTTVATAAATDVDAGDAIAYSLTGADAGKFAINSSSGAVTFKSAPNFEAPGSAASSNVYSFNVVATDNGTLMASQAWTVTVTNANEAPVLSGPATANVAENSTDVATFSVADQDSPDAYVYTVGGTDGALFKMVGDQLVFVAAPDFENPADSGANNVYDVTVKAADLAGANSNTIAIAVTVTDVLAPTDFHRLTTGADGTSGAPIVANSFDGTTASGVTTVNDSDWLQGSGPTPTLLFGTAATGGPALVTPHLTGVGSIAIQAGATSGSNTMLSLANSTGTTDIAFTSGFGLSAGVQDMKSTTTNLKVDQTTATVANIIFDYATGQAPSTVNLSLGDGSGVAVTNLNLGVGAKAGGTTSGTGITQLNLSLSGNNTIGSSTANGLDSAIAFLNLTNNGGTLTINGLNQSSLARIDLNASSGTILLQEVGAAGGLLPGFQLNGGSATADVTANLDNAAAVSVSSGFTTGAGNDTLFTTGATAFQGQVSTGNGNDTVNIGSGQSGAGTVADLAGGSSINLGAGQNTVNVADLLIGIVGASSIVGGKDVDTISFANLKAIGAAASSISAGDGNDVVTGSGNLEALTSIDGGLGDDAITVNGTVAGTVQGGAGDDSITVVGSVSGSVFGDAGAGGANGNDRIKTGSILTGGTVVADGADTVLVSGTITNKVGVTAVLLDKDNDVLWVKNGTGTSITQVASSGIAVDGGSETDMLVFDNSTGGTLTAVAGLNANNAINAFETLQLLNQVGGSIALDLVQVSGAPRVDLLSLDGVASTFSIAGMGGNGSNEALFLTGAIAQLSGWLPTIDSKNLDDTATTALNVATLVDASALSLTLETAQGITLTLDDTSGVTPKFGSATVAITNTSQNQTINLVNSAGSDDFLVSFTVTGSAAGRTVTLGSAAGSAIDSATIAAAIAANVKILAGQRADDAAVLTLDRSITTDGGDDTIDFRTGFLDGGDGVTTNGDTVAMGGNSATFVAATLVAASPTTVQATAADRLIIANTTDQAGDRDGAFEKVSGVEVLQVDGAGLKIYLGDGAKTSGIVEIDTVAGTSATVETGGAFAASPLTVLAAAGSTFTYVNAANVSTNFVVNLDNTTAGAGQDATLALTNAGTGTVTVTVKIDANDATTLSTAAAGSAATSELTLTVAAGGVDKVTLVDSNVDSKAAGVFEAGDADNSAVTVTTNNWGGGGSITIDASGVDDFDSVSTTGTLKIDAASETGAVTILGGANDNTLSGSTTKANVLTGGAGNDVLTGGSAGDVLTGGGGVDQIVGGAGNDQIDGGGGIDLLIGGAGRDIIRGAGNGDTILVTAFSDSSLGSSSAGTVDSVDSWVDIDFATDFVQLPIIPTVFGGILTLNMAATTVSSLAADLAARSEVQALMALGGNAALVVNITGNAAIDTEFDLTVGEANNGITGFLLVDTNGNNAYDAADFIAHLSDDATVKNVAAITAGALGTKTTFNQMALDSNPSAPTLQFQNDTGSSSSDNITKDNQLQFKGTARNDAPAGGTDTIVVWDDTNNNGVQDGSETTLLTSTAAAFVAGFSADTAPVLAEGAHNIRVREELVTSGGVKIVLPVGAATVVSIDSTAPTAPTMLDLQVASDKGTSNSDNITNLTTLVFDVTGVEVGTTITIYNDVDGDNIVDGGETLGTKLAASATETVTIVGISAGTYTTVKAILTDAVGNISGPAALKNGPGLTVDTTVPTAPTGLDLQTASDSQTATYNTKDGGSFASTTADNNTSDSTPTFDVSSTENGATVSLFDDVNNDGDLDLGETVLGTGTGNGGTISITTSSLADGTYKVRAFQTDVAGNISTATAAITTVIDTTAPAAPGAPDLRTASDSGSSSADNYTNVNNGKFDVTGTETGALVVLFADVDLNGVYDAGTDVIVDDKVATGATTTLDLASDTDAVVLGSGTHRLRSFQVDVAGNISAVSTETVVTVDKSTPTVSLSKVWYDRATNYLSLYGTFETDGAGGGTHTIDVTKINIDNTDLASGQGDSIVINTGTMLVLALAGTNKAVGATLDDGENVKLSAGFWVDLAGNASTFTATILSDAQLVDELGGGTPTAFGDLMAGTAGQDYVDGLGGADFLFGQGGSDFLRGNAGNDQITGGAAADTAIFEATATANGTDTFTDFTVGTDGDVLDFGAFLQQASNTLTNATNTGAIALTNGTAYQLNFTAGNIAGKNYAGADFGDLFGAGKPFSGIADANGHSVIIVRGADQADILYVTNDATAGVLSSEVALVGILQGNVGALVQADYLRL